MCRQGGQQNDRGGQQGQVTAGQVTACRTQTANGRTGQGSKRARRVRDTACRRARGSPLPCMHRGVCAPPALHAQWGCVCDCINDLRHAATRLSSEHSSIGPNSSCTLSILNTENQNTP